MLRLLNGRLRVLTALSLIFLGVLAETQVGPAYCMSEFNKYFKGLGVSDTRVNPVERFVFSLLLTRTKPDGQARGIHTSVAEKHL